MTKESGEKSGIEWAGREVSGAPDPSSGADPGTAGWESTPGFSLEAVHEGTCRPHPVRDREDARWVLQGLTVGSQLPLPAWSHPAPPSHVPIHPPSAWPDTMGPAGHCLAPVVSFISLNCSKKGDVALLRSADGTKLERIVNKTGALRREAGKEMPAFMQLGQSSVNPPGCGGGGGVGGRWAGKPVLEMQMFFAAAEHSLKKVHARHPVRL